MSERKCKVCGKIIDDKRIDAEFCSDKCKQRWYYETDENFRSRKIRQVQQWIEMNRSYVSSYLKQYYEDNKDDILWERMERYYKKQKEMKEMGIYKEPLGTVIDPPLKKDDETWEEFAKRLHNYAKFVLGINFKYHENIKNGSD